VVPSGIGTLNIMIKKHIADSSATVGTCRVFTVLLTRRTPTAHIGAATAKPTAHVAGDR
jgi:hypothetical protein